MAPIPTLANALLPTVAARLPATVPAATAALAVGAEARQRRNQGSAVLRADPRGGERVACRPEASSAAPARALN